MNAKKSKTIICIFVACLMTVMSACTNANTTGSGSSGGGTPVQNNNTAAADPAEIPEQESVSSETGLESGEAFKRDENGYPDLEGNQFEVWQIDYRGVANYAEYDCIKNIEELFNCSIEIIHPPRGQEAENFSMLMASSDLPDMIFSDGIDSYYAGGLTAAYSDGVLYDYTDYINETHTPRFLELVANDSFYQKIVKDDEGRYVRLGTKLQGSNDFNFLYGGVAWIREDNLNDTGLSSPETIDDWYNLLTAFKDNGVEFPLLVSDNIPEYFAYAWNLNRDGFVIGEDMKTVEFSPYTSEFGKYLETMALWYSEGLINQDFPNLSGDDAMAMVMDDRAGSASLHAWNVSFPYYEAISKDQPDKKLIAAQIPKLSSTGPLSRVRQSTRNIGDYKYITTDAKNPLACVYLLDALYAPEISTELGRGIEGYAWEIVDGIIHDISIPDDADMSLKLKGTITQWHMYEDSDREEILGYKYGKPGVKEAMLLWNECPFDRYFPSRYLSYNAEEEDVRSRISTDINTYVSEMSLKFITGVEPMSNFDNYIAKLKAMGIEEYIAVTQSAFDRYNLR